MNRSDIMAITMVCPKERTWSKSWAHC
jgi:hypothetical protein